MHIPLGRATGRRRSTVAPGWTRPRRRRSAGLFEEVRRSPRRRAVGPADRRIRTSSPDRQDRYGFGDELASAEEPEVGAAAVGRAIPFASAPTHALSLP